MKERIRVPAFKDELAPHSEHAGKTRDDTLLQMGDRQDKVIRPMRWTHMLEKRRWHAKESGDVTAEEFAILSKRHFDELRQYGINAPVSFVVADAETEGGVNQKEVFAIVDNVHRAENPDKAAVGEAYVSMRRDLLRYYTDVYIEQRSFLADLVKDQQYVYGRKEGDASDDLYLVDVTPYIYWSPHMLRRILKDLCEQLEAEREHFQDQSFEPIIQGTQQLVERIDRDLASEAHDS